MDDIRDMFGSQRYEHKKEEEILQEMIQILRERGITKDGADSTDGDL